MLLKQKNPSLPKKLVLGTFDELLAMFSTMINLLHLLYLTTQRCCASDKAKFSAKDFTDNSNLDDLDISLPVFSSTSNVKLHNIFIFPKIVKKVIMKLDPSRHLVQIVFQWWF